MWPKGLDSYLSVSEIRDYSSKHRIKKTQMEIRSIVKIAVVDDEKFDARSNLVSYGYDITELPDLRSVKEIEKYDIILCDLMGVGLNFDRMQGGASIIKEVKMNYPTKYVIAYTGARANSSEAQAAKEYADLFLKKDADISKWVEELDSAIDLSLNPYFRWILTRQALLEAEVDIRRVVELEDAYVSAVKARDSTFSGVNNVLGKVDVGGNAKAIIQGVISSAVYQAMFS